MIVWSKQVKKNSAEKDYKIMPPTGCFAFIGLFRENDCKFYLIAFGKVYFHPPEELQTKQPVGGIILLVFLLLLNFESHLVTILYFI